MPRHAQCPPAVQYPLGRSWALGWGLLGLLLVGAAVLVAWVVSGVRSPWGVGLLVGCLWLAVAGGALHFWWWQCVGMLRWDGRVWVLESDLQGGIFGALSLPPEVILDLQTRLWVCVRPSGRRPVWVFLERASLPERWMDLRRAVYSRATPGADTADETAPASAVGREPEYP